MLSVENHTLSVTRNSGAMVNGADDMMNAHKNDQLRNGNLGVGNNAMGNAGGPVGYGFENINKRGDMYRKKVFTLLDPHEVTKGSKPMKKVLQ